MTTVGSAGVTGLQGAYDWVSDAKYFLLVGRMSGQRRKSRSEIWLLTILQSLLRGTGPD